MITTRAIQEHLMKLGHYKGPIDGIIGAGSLVAIAKALGIGEADPVTLRVMLELLSHEAIVQEAYKDSVGVWTWGVGVTSASGHSVERYKDNPQTIQKCLEVFVWLVRNKYAPAVLAAFKGAKLAEHQFAAALSFHYNTGAIGRAGWVDSFLAGKPVQARQQFMNWNKPASIIGRREKERDLFFNGKWSNDGKTNLFPVRKPSYAPNWGAVKRVDVASDLTKAMLA